MSLAAKTESESLFLNAGEAVQHIKTLEELRHIQTQSYSELITTLPQ